MGLFDKKFCDICGEKISFLGNHKLEDGNMCSACNKKMSPFFSGRRKTTVAEMKEHLAEREANRARLATFNVNAVYGDSKKVYVDTANGNFMVTYAAPGNFEKDNPDIIPLSAVTRCDLDVKEQREEEFSKDANGNRVSYNPRRYRYFYDFKVVIGVNWKWFDEIDINLNTTRVEGMQSARYHQFELMGQQIRNALTGQPITITQTYANAQPLTGADLLSMMAQANVAASAASGSANSSVASVSALGSQQAPVSVAASQAAPISAAQPTANVQAAPTSAAQPTANTFSNVAPNWMCPSCGRSNDGAFCSNCGTKKPEPKPLTTHTEFKTAAPNWMCPSCGRSNDGAFCSNCGTKKPAPRKKCQSCGWLAPVDGAPNFCPQCGSKLE